MEFEPPRVQSKGQIMIRALVALAIVSPAIAQAQTACRGMTYSDNFQSGASAWQSTISAVDSSKNNPMQASAGLEGLVLNANPSKGSWLENTGFSQTYGTFKATVDVSQGALASDMTTAVWLLADHIQPGSNQPWPAEIDFWETQGGTFDSAMHSGFTSNNAPFYTPATPGQHTVMVDWQPDTITWFLDGVQTNQQPTPPDFNTPMHFILDTMNMGGSSDGSMTVLSVQAFDNLQNAEACDSLAGPFAGGPTNQPAPQDIPTGGWVSRDIVCTSKELPTASISPSIPPPPVTAEGMAAFNAAAGVKQQSVTLISDRQSVLCDVQDGLGRLLALQAAAQRR